MTTADVENKVREIEKLKGMLEMTATLCHDLNQPLMAVSAYSELISMQLPQDDPVHATIGKMADQVIKMGEITRRLTCTLTQASHDDRVG